MNNLQCRLPGLPQAHQAHYAFPFSELCTLQRFRSAAPLSSVSIRTTALCSGHSVPIQSEQPAIIVRLSVPVPAPACNLTRRGAPSVLRRSRLRLATGLLSAPTDRPGWCLLPPAASQSFSSALPLSFLLPHSSPSIHPSPRPLSDSTSLLLLSPLFSSALLYHSSLLTL